VIPALLQIAPALGGVAEIEGVIDTRSKKVTSKTLNLIENIIIILQVIEKDIFEIVRLYPSKFTCKE
jgi:hypothetical protein